MKKVRPFGIEHLVEVSEDEARRVNGGRHRRRKHHPLPPPVFTTDHVSLPQPGLPTGDHG